MTHPPMTRLQPGVYADADGNLHIDATELLIAAGVADTPANHALVLEAARIVFAGIPVTQTDDPILALTCPHCRRTSYHPADVHARYCSACDRFLDD